MATVFDLDADAAVELWWERIDMDSVWCFGVWDVKRWIPIFEVGISGIVWTIHCLVSVVGVHMRYDYEETVGWVEC